MKTDLNNLSRAEKILVFLYDFGQGKIVKVRYEDIVVGVFKKYPEDFHLKGYKEYPDTGDLIHKPLYDFRKKGYVNAVSKVFSLTDRGIEFAKRLTGKSIAIPSGDRLSRSASAEMIRIKDLEGFILFLEGKGAQLSENDFYNYLGVTVRTRRNAFIGRLETMDALIIELKKHKNDRLYESVHEYHKFLMEKYKNIIEFFTTQK